MRKAILSALTGMTLLITACSAAAQIAPREAAVRPAGDVGGAALQGKAPAAPPSISSSAAEANIPRLDRLIIANVNMSVSVENAIDASRAAERIAERYGGFVGTSEIRDTGTVREANVTLRIPSQSLNAALAELRAMGSKVTSESRATQDVTEEFTDVESSVRNLRTTEAQLLALMERASKMDEILGLQRELTGVRGQIERLEGRRRVLENRVDLATISLKLFEPVIARGGWSALDTLGEAVAALVRIGQTAAGLAIWAVVLFPVYGLPIVGAWLLARRSRAPQRIAAGA